MGIGILFETYVLGDHAPEWLRSAAALCSLIAVGPVIYLLLGSLVTGQLQALRILYILDDVIGGAAILALTLPVTVGVLSVASYLYASPNDRAQRRRRLAFLLLALMCPVVAGCAVYGLLRVHSYVAGIEGMGARYGRIITQARRLVSEAGRRILMSTSDSAASALPPGSFIVLEYHWRPFHKAGYIVSRRFHPPTFQVARGPEDVRMVVVIDKYSETVAEYVSGRRDCRHVFWCYLLDLKSDAVLESAEFRGTTPGSGEGMPAGRAGSFGSEPWEKVERWIVKHLGRGGP
jgi:hypothetical protein